MSAHPAFLHALQSFTEHLSSEDNERIQQPISLSELVEQAIQLGEELEKKPSALLTLSQSALLLNQFETCMVDVCKSKPAMTGLIWSSVLFTLRLAQEDVKGLDVALNFFERMAEEVKDICLQENTLSALLPVQSVVENVYASIIKFWVQAVKHYQAIYGGPAALPVALSSALTISLDDEFRELSCAVAKEKVRLNQAPTAQLHANTAPVNVSPVPDTSQSYQHSSAVSTQTSIMSVLQHSKNNQISGSQIYVANGNIAVIPGSPSLLPEQVILKDWLKASSYAQDFRAAEEHRYKGTCEWIQRKPQYLDWSTSSSNPFLFLYGILGAGKTVLSSWIINQCQTAPDFNSLVLYHYFNAANNEKSTPESALRSFIDQLYNQYWDANSSLLPRLESYLNATRVKQRHPDFADFWDIFSKCVSDFVQATEPTNPRVLTIIMDAVDECQKSDRWKFVGRLLTLIKKYPGNIKLLITGRPTASEESRSPLHSRDLVPIVHLEITTEDVQHDIQSYVRHTIYNIPRLFTHETLRNRLSEEIGAPANHQGMFLWAYLMCMEVDRQGTTKALHSLLDQLPQGLDAMYARICQTVIERGDSLAVPALQWLVHSPRPLHFLELKEGLRLMFPPDRVSGSMEELLFDEWNDILWAPQDIVDACGNLVTYSESGDTLALVHVSAIQFFGGFDSANQARGSLGVSSGLARG
ncbi:hypothetical protein H0H92_004099 [Tricholoma furcatifolium]|nr:hypothetical protein H0H92_004099 [Tricholoma furcatifolium]